MYNRYLKILQKNMENKNFTAYIIVSNVIHVHIEKSEFNQINNNLF